jgi:hypothetical protein
LQAGCGHHTRKKGNHDVTNNLSRAEIRKVLERYLRNGVNNLSRAEIRKVLERYLRNGVNNLSRAEIRKVLRDTGIYHIDRTVLERYLRNGVNNQYLLTDIAVNFPGLLPWLHHNRSASEFLASVHEFARTRRTMTAKQIMAVQGARGSTSDVEALVPRVTLDAGELYGVFSENLTSDASKLRTHDFIVSSSDGGATLNIHTVLDKTLVATVAEKGTCLVERGLAHDIQKMLERLLTVLDSIKKGIGPVCATRFPNGWGSITREWLTAAP